MGLGDFHRHRRLGSVFALLGVLIYTALIPGHVVSQALPWPSDRVQTAGIEGLTVPICHGAAEESSAPNRPAAPHKKCPFCTGYAAFAVGLASSCDAGIVDAELAAFTFHSQEQTFVQGVVRRPQNRGPPHLSI